MTSTGGIDGDKVEGGIPVNVDNNPVQNLPEVPELSRLERVQNARKQKKLQAQSKLFPMNTRVRKPPPMKSKSKKKKKSEGFIPPKEHASGPPSRESLDMWGPDDINKVAKKKRNKRSISHFKVRKVHPGQSYNPDKSQFFEAYKEVQEFVPPPKLPPKKKKKKKKKSKEKKILGDDVLEGVLASQGVYDNIYDRNDDLEPPLVFRKKKRKRKKKPKRKDLAKKKKSKAQKKKKKKKDDEEEEEEEDVDKIIRKVDENIAIVGKNVEKRVRQKRRRVHEDITSVTDSILGTNDLDLDVYRNLKEGNIPIMSGIKNDILFNDMTTKRMEIREPPNKKRKLYHN